MSYQESSLFCRQCARQTLVRRARANHVLHLLLSVFTCGLWLVPWALISVKIGGWRCAMCGRKVTSPGMAAVLLVALAVAGAAFGLLMLGVIVSNLRH